MTCLILFLRADGMGLSFIKNEPAGQNGPLDGKLIKQNNGVMTKRHQFLFPFHHHLNF